MYIYEAPGALRTHRMIRYMLALNRIQDCNQAAVATVPNHIDNV